MKARFGKSLRLRILPLLVTLLAVVSWSEVARATVDDACVTSIGGLGGSVTLDGVVDTDPTVADKTDVGWNGATRILLKSESGTARASVLQLGMDAGFVYLGGVVDSPEVAATDRIMLGFSSAAPEARKDWRIIITPFATSDVGSTVTFSNHRLTAGRVIYWRDGSASDACSGNAAWTCADSTTAADTDWLVANFAYARSGTSWSFELKIPRAASADVAGPTTGIYFPPSAPFRFYYDVLSSNTFDDVAPIVHETPWPKTTLVGNIAGSEIFLTKVMPPQSQWGSVSLYDRPECTGVYLRQEDIGVLDPLDSTQQNIIQEMKRIPDSAISQPDAAACDALADTHNWPSQKGPNNVFVARPTNTSTRAARVSATFRIADWGFGNQWVKVGHPAALGVSDINPTLEKNIPASNNNPPNPATATTLTMDWAASYKQSCQYKYRWHQCIHVDLDSTDTTDTRIKSKSVERNMNFVPASTVKDEATIGTVGAPPPPAGRAAHGYVLRVMSDVLSASREKALSGAGVLAPRCSGTDPNANTDPACCAGGAPTAATSPMNVSRIRHTATVLPDGRVLVAGARGDATPWVGVDSTEIYDPATNTWAPGKPLSRPRFDHAAVSIGTSGVLLIGGGNDSKNEAMGASSDFYSIDKQAWVAGPSLPQGYLDVSAVPIDDERILVAGGQWYDTLVYYPSKNVFAKAGMLKQLHGQGRLVALADRRALFVGTGEIPEVFLAAEKAWKQTSRVGARRQGHTVTRLGDGKVLVIGGFAGQTQTASAEIYDPATNEWRPARDMSTPRAHHTATLLSDGRVLVTGGFAAAKDPSKTAEIYDPVANTWAAAPALAASRGFHTATLLSDGTVLLAGGAQPPSSERYSIKATTGNCTVAARVAAARAAGEVVAAPPPRDRWNTVKWTVCGSRRTGKMLVIDKQKFELMSEVGCYGYYARHFLQKPEPPDGKMGVAWSSVLEGGQMKTLRAPGTATADAPAVGYYGLDIAPGQKAKVSAVIRATEVEIGTCTQVFGKINCCRCALGTGLGDDDLDGRLSLLVAAALLGLAVHRRRRAN